jgi:mRNA interferase ChpB
MRPFKQGDIVLISLDPVLGVEQQGQRPVLVVSNEEFNRGGTTLVAVITQGGQLARVQGWAVTLMGCGTQTQGAIIISQSRMVDLAARHAKKIEAVPARIMDEVIAKFSAVF